MTQAEDRTLHALDEAPAPAELIAGFGAWSQVRELSHAELAELFEVWFEPGEADQRTARVGRAARRLEIDPEACARAVHTAGTLMQAAARQACNVVMFYADLEVLGGAPVLHDGLARVYEQKFPALRAEAIREAIEIHGWMLDGVDWRMDTIGSSSRAAKLEMPVAMVTFHYRAGSKFERLTLQMLPDMVAELHAVCGTLLGR